MVGTTCCLSNSTSAASPSLSEALAGGLGDQSELEKRMSPSLGNVLLGLGIDTDPDPP